MPAFSSEQLITGLTLEVEQTLTIAGRLALDSDESLNFKPGHGSWSVLQVLVHLNSYNRYYLPQISRSMQRQPARPKAEFKSGFFGNYFTNMMQPAIAGRSFKKYKSPKDHTPTEAQISRQVLSEFMEGQRQLMTLLEKARQYDLSKIKVPVSISRFIRLMLGDTFRFLIAHQMRHFGQIDRIGKQRDRTPLPHGRQQVSC